MVNGQDFVKDSLNDENNFPKMLGTGHEEHVMDINEYSKERRQNQMPGQSDPILQNLEQYWQTLRHAQRLPARNDIAPSKLDDALPYAFILQRVAPGTARFRVAGQKLHDLLKMDARGMPVSTVFLPEAREQVQDLLEAAFIGPAIISIPLVSPGTLMRPVLHGTMLLLPMRDSADQPTRVLGALVTGPHSGTRPRRFMIEDSARIRHESIGVQLATSQLIPRGPAPMEKPDTARPALKLVVNNG